MPLTLIAAQIASGDFTVVNSCGNSLNAHSTCSLAVAFQPHSIGPATGTLTLSDQYRTQTIALTGTGIAPPGVTLSPASPLNFPATGVGLSTLSPTITLSNNNLSPLLLQNLTVTGDFAIVPASNTCGTTLAATTACTLQIAFAPTGAGPRIGFLTITDNSPTSPHILQLAGTGVDFTLTANGSTTATIASGQNAVYPLLLTSAAATPGTATFTCTGAPANATCNVTPGSIALGSTATISVTVLTGVSSATLTPAPSADWRTSHPMVGKTVAVEPVPAAPQAPASSRQPRASLRARHPVRMRLRPRHPSSRLSQPAAWSRHHTVRNLHHRRLSHQRRPYPHHQPHPHRPVGHKGVTVIKG